MIAFVARARLVVDFLNCLQCPLVEFGGSGLEAGGFGGGLGVDRGGIVEDGGDPEVQEVRISIIEPGSSIKTSFRSWLSW